MAQSSTQSGATDPTTTTTVTGAGKLNETQEEAPLMQPSDAVSPVSPDKPVPLSAQASITTVQLPPNQSKFENKVCVSPSACSDSERDSVIWEAVEVNP